MTVVGRRTGVSDSSHGAGRTRTPDFKIPRALSPQSGKVRESQEEGDGERPRFNHFLSLWLSSSACGLW